jgi:poly-gamma-glutamate synthesis protein (capsule biosynthesis protein)
MPTDGSATTLFLGGDVMPGRGIDQILEHPCHPTLHETWIRDAREYVALAERRAGPLPRRVPPPYVWGDALAELAARRPDARIVNLETAVTRSAEAWPGKGVHYHTSPEHAATLVAAGIGACTLANNHVLDWGWRGLDDTLRALDVAGIRHAGAGRDLAEAEAPAVLDLPGNRRVLLYAAGTGSSGIPDGWAAGPRQPGVNLLRDLSARRIDRIGERVTADRRPGDVVVMSIHWGPNWGYEIQPEERGFARELVTRAGVDVVHGHSSHHVKALEVIDGRLVLYGCGDLLDDYEGIGGYEAFRGDIGALWFVAVDATGALLSVELVPTRMRRFQVRRGTIDDARWLQRVLEGTGPGAVRMDVTPEGTLTLSA